VKKTVKILLIHNKYKFRGGEDVAAEAEARLFEAHNHSVIWYERRNEDFTDLGAIGSMKAGIETFWSSRSFRELKTLILNENPDVAHFHNTFPLISPAAYYACAEASIPVVQTLHNYRLLCPGALLMRDGKVCEECLGRAVAWPGIAHACYRGDRAATTALATMQLAHRVIGTWQDKVQMYIALSEFARHKFIEGGLPADRIVVKPNFVMADPGAKEGPGEYALFVGRLSEEKGLRVLLDAWTAFDQTIPLRIAGDGPLTKSLVERIRANDIRGVNLLGRIAPENIPALIHDARFLILPSICYENFPVTVAEAFAGGLPVIASRLGSLLEIIADGSNGLHFSPGDPQDLAEKVQWAWAHPNEMQKMGRVARADYKAKYSAEKNYEHLLSLWNHLGISASL
jgi:glycosyltransferase involved in cell wall biosynthesis